MDSPIIKAKTRQEVAAEYGIDRKTLNKWFKMADLNIPNGLIKPCNVFKIYDTFGFPANPYPQVSSKIPII